MARMQILELPEGSGDDRPPFVLIIDQYEPRRYIMGAGQDPEPIDEFDGIAEKIGARAVLVFNETIDIFANDTSAYAVGGLLPASAEGPDFTSPIAGKVEVRKPCPHCGDRQMIPTHQFREHLARLHPDESADA